MRALFLTIVLGIASLGWIALTPSHAEARYGRGGWYRGYPAYYGGWRGGSHWRGWYGGSPYYYPAYRYRWYPRYYGYSYPLYGSYYYSPGFVPYYSPGDSYYYGY